MPDYGQDNEFGYFLVPPPDPKMLEDLEYEELNVKSTVLRLREESAV